MSVSQLERYKTRVGILNAALSYYAGGYHFERKHNDRVGIVDEGELAWEAIKKDIEIGIADGDYDVEAAKNIADGNYCADAYLVNRIKKHMENKV